MNVLECSPRYIFRLELQPEISQNLLEVDEKIEEICIDGKTKNLQKLKDLNNLYKVWIRNVNQQEFTTILSMINPKMLYIYQLRVEDLSAIGSLTRLEVVSLEWNSKTKNLWDMANQHHLKALSIKDFSKLDNVDLLQTSNKLKIVELSGGESKPLKCTTLAPLKNLTKLKYLSLENMSIQDQSLEPLAQLTNLVELSISNQFPTEEFARLSVYLQDTKCDQFNPYKHLSSPIGDKDVMVTGKRKPFLSSKKDKEKLKKYANQFEELRSTYSKERKDR